MARRDKGYATAICSGGGLRCREGFLASQVLAFLHEESNRALLAWIGGGLGVLATGLWAVFVHFYPKPEAKHGPPVQARDGSASVGGNVSNSTITTGVTPELLAALSRRWEELSESQKEKITKLQADLDLNQRQVKSALEILGEANVHPRTPRGEARRDRRKIQGPSNGGDGTTRRRRENHRVEGGGAKGDPGRLARQGGRNFGYDRKNPSRRVGLACRANYRPARRCGLDAGALSRRGAALFGSGSEGAARA